MLISRSPPRNTSLVDQKNQAKQDHMELHHSHEARQDFPHEYLEPESERIGHITENHDKQSKRCL